MQSLFAFGSGGFAGTGLGLGSPQKIPAASTDFVFAAIGEELGLLGTVGVLHRCSSCSSGAGFRIAVRADRPFSKLFAAGLTRIIGVQTFLIIGGVTRVIPLTGITLPFISYGGSSLVANFVVIALLLRISDETAEREETPRPAAARRACSHMNRAIRRVGIATIVLVLVLVAAARPTCRCSTPTRWPTIPATSAPPSVTSRDPGARSSPPTARSSPGRWRPTTS